MESLARGVSLHAILKTRKRIYFRRRALKNTITPD